MSDTPRTDAEESHGFDEHGGDQVLVSADFARQLERELNEAKRDANNCRQIISTYCDEVDALTKDRNHWKQRAEKAEADSKRLDWLEKNNIRINKPEGIYPWSISISASGECIRQAIDAAMKGEVK